MCSALPLPTDPIRLWKRRNRVSLIVGVVAVSASVGWAAWPHAQHEQSIPPIKPRQPVDDQSIEPQINIDPRVFAVKLWNPPPLPEAPIVAQAPPPPKPLNVQLIGIIEEAGIYKAALYDADADELLIVADGQKVKNHTVKIVSSQAIELSDGSSVLKLSLQPEDRS